VQVEVAARARLHFGFLDLSGSGERRFGGIGLSISRPRVLMKLESRAGSLEVTGAQAGRIGRLAERFYEAAGLRRGATIRVEEAIPEHVGLGSGTQTALALAAGLARLHGVDLPPDRLAAITGRARRSGIGYHTFLGGGFVVEGGHPVDAGARETEAPPPLLTRHEFPDDWRIVLLLPAAARTISGTEEEAAFRRLPPADEVTSGALARIVLMRLLPALVERRLRPFGEALAEVQAILGSCFAAVQDGAFHPAGALLARSLRQAGALGVGQSSWGPAIYAFAADEREEERLRGIAREVDPRAAIVSARGLNRGASVEVR
jgi:beta-ribofuranosylaminobenzene 5'-phosphate synthase